MRPGMTIRQGEHMSISRRSVLAAGAGAAAAACTSSAALPVTAFHIDGALHAAGDEAYWREVAAAYDVMDGVVNLENGNWGLMARPVLARYTAHTETVNRRNSYFARREYGEMHGAINARLAAALGAGPDEIAITRGATEALKALIAGYNRLQPGDGVMFADLDYGSIQNAMAWKAAQTGGRVVRLSVPEPATHDGLIAFYDAAMAASPDVRLLLLTHVSHRTGLAMSVADIVAAARLRGVDVIVDAAHSWGQMDFDVTALGADFVGFNLHKWIGAPIGVGAMYIRADRLESISPDMSAEPWERERTVGRVHTGTMNFAAVMSIPDALDFHAGVGPASKAARLAYLRNAWVEQVRPLEAVEILTPDDPRLHAGITSFRMKGKTSAEDNKALAERLLSEFGIFSVLRDGVAAGCCVRITPALYNTPEHADRLAEALHKIAQDA